MCKQLNGSVLKSLKSKRFGPKSEKKIGRDLAKILYFASGQARPARAGLNSGRIFNFSFVLGRLGQKFQFRFQAEMVRDCCHEAGPVPGLKNLHSADL